MSFKVPLSCCLWKTMVWFIIISFLFTCYYIISHEVDEVVSPLRWGGHTFPRWPSMGRGLHLVAWCFWSGKTILKLLIIVSKYLRPAHIRLGSLNFLAFWHIYYFLQHMRNCIYSVRVHLNLYRVNKLRFTSQIQCILWAYLDTWIINTIIEKLNDVCVRSIVINLVINGY